MFVGLFVVFHLIENWRGRREWQRVKTELEAKGESLDFDTFLKPPVPDEQNVMAHPYMKKRFIKESLVAQLPKPEESGLNYPSVALGGPPFELSELGKLPRGDKPVESLAKLIGDQSSSEVIPMLQFTNQPLACVVAELAALAGLKASFATNGVPWEQPASKVVSPPGAVQPVRNASVLQTRVATGAMEPVRITRTFTNVTAFAALAELCGERALTPDVQRWREQHVLDVSLTLRGLSAFFERSGGAIAQLDEAFERPISRLPYDRLRPSESPSVSFAFGRHISLVMCSRCKVHLLMGEPDAALKDLQRMRFAFDAIQAHEPPLLVEAMTRVGLAGLLASTVEETMANGLWPQTHLEGVQKTCAGLDLSADVLRAWRGGERAWRLRELDSSEAYGRLEKTRYLFGEYVSTESWRPLDKTDAKEVFLHFLSFAVPDGWVDQNKAHFSRAMQIILADQDLTHSVAYPSGTKEIMVVIDWDVRFCCYRMLTLISIPNFVKIRTATQRSHLRLNLAYVALALERHRAAKGAYPDTLAALVPEFAASLPHDLFDGQPLRYRRTDDGKYLLYSIGWDSKDDGGISGTGKDGKLLPFGDGPDWVWQGVPRK